MKSFLRKILLSFGEILGLNFIFKRINISKTRILMYHGVTDENLPSFYWTSVSEKNFALQMGYIKEHYNPVPISEILRSQEETDSKVVITFDDGLKNVFTNARYIVQKLKLPSICFVLPELSENGEVMWTDRLYSAIMKSNKNKLDLSSYGLNIYEFSNTGEQKYIEFRRLSDELKGEKHSKREKTLDFIFNEWADRGLTPYDQFLLMTDLEIAEIADLGKFEIGPHTNRHPILSTMEPEEQRNEIAGCLKKLSEKGINYPAIFAYPNGRAQDFNKTTIEILKENGIKAALTTIDGFFENDDDLFRIKRIPVGADMGMLEFKARLSGYFYFLKKLF